MLESVSVLALIVGITAACSTQPSGSAGSTTGMQPSDSAGSISTTESMPPIPTLDTSGVIASTWSQGVGLQGSADEIPSEIAEPTLPPLIARIGWGAEGQILLVTWGSGFCPKLPTQATVEDPTTLRIEVRQVEPPEAKTQAACSADLSPTTSLFAAPDGLDSGKAITVKVGADVTLMLPPKP